MIFEIKSLFRIAFNTLYATEGASSRASTKTNFLAVLREAIFWQIDGRELRDDVEEVTGGILDNMAEG